MKSILRATAILSGSSMITILVGLGSSKAWAMLLGPSGVGFMGLLQSLTGIAALIATMGVGTGLVRMGASAIEQGDAARLAAIYRAAWLIFGGFGLLAVILMAIFSRAIALLMLGNAANWPYVILMSLTVLFTMAAGIQSGFINAHHRVAILARIAITNSVLSSALGLLIVWYWGKPAVPGALVAMAAMSCTITAFQFYRSGITSAVSPHWASVRKAVRELLHFGGPYTLSLLVGQGVQMLMPALVLHQLGADSVGYYRAAIAISVTYLGFLLNAMGQDYYPRISAAAHNPTDLVALVNQQHRLVLLLSVPLFFGMLALAPLLIQLVYSPAFAPAIVVLKWQLMGSLLKFSSWTMAFVILARCNSAVFLFTEAIGGITTFAVSWLCIPIYGLAGLGMGFFATYVVYYLLVWSIVRHEIGFRWSRENLVLLTSALVAVISVFGLSFVVSEVVQTIISLIIACIAASISAYTIWIELRKPQLANAK